MVRVVRLSPLLLGLVALLMAGAPAALGSARDASAPPIATRSEVGSQAAARPAASLDLNKLDKSKIIPGKNGAKYYNFTIIVNDNPDQYGKDVQLKDGQTKEQREAKEKAPFIGGGKTVWKSNPEVEPQPTAKAQEPESDLPF